MLYHAAVPPTVPGVLFAEDFGDDDEHEFGEPPDSSASDAADLTRELPPTADPVRTAAEIEEDRAAMRNEGFAAGLRAAESGLAAQRARILEDMASQIERSFQDAHKMIENSLGTVADAALSALVECFPALCDRHGASELRALVRSLLPSLTDELKLTATVHPSMEEVVRQEIVALKANPEQIMVKTSSDMLTGDVTLAWADGVASRNVGRWQNDMIDRLMNLSSGTNRGSSTP